MRFDPTLVVRRLVIKRNESSAYDENFHEGVNVVYGDNSSGKSTILNFIFYGLGGELTDWSEVALLCSRVFIEAEINGLVVTLSREVSDKSGQPMDFYGGDYEQSQEAPSSEWLRYPYRKSENRESFSQAMFRLLNIPEVETDLSGNVTINQVLRLLYSDQLSPIDDIFRFEQFDPQGLRDTVGRLLCGAYDNTLYQNELRIRALTKELDTVHGELKSLLQVLGRTEDGFTTDWIEAERVEATKRQEVLQEEIQAAERELYSVSRKDTLTLDAQRAAYDEVQRLQEKLVEVRQNKDALVFTIADSAAFKRGLEAKIEALHSSAVVEGEIGTIRFETCPACYAVLDEVKGNEVCFLCKAPLDQERARDRIAAIISDLGIQVRQSELLQSRRQEELARLEHELDALTREWDQASQRLRELERLPSSEATARLRELNRQAGYLQRELEDLNRRAQIAHLVDELSSKKIAIQAELEFLRSANEKIRASQERRLRQAYTMISDQVTQLLRNDLRRQDSFEEAQGIEFSFGDNKITVDGKSYFSASSRAILKSSFCLGFLAAATKAPFFRHPRFCMIDTLENMGVEPTRSQNFQHQIMRVSQEAKAQHQIIYATAMIAADLDEPRHKVGRTYTRDRRTLDIASN